MRGSVALVLALSARAALADGEPPSEDAVRVVLRSPDPDATLHLVLRREIRAAESRVLFWGNTTFRHRLYNVTSRTAALCGAPCDTMVPRLADYLIDGDGIVASSTFQMPAGAPAVGIDVETGSLVARGFAIAALVAGALGIVVGVGSLVHFSTLNDQWTNRRHALPTETTYDDILRWRSLGTGLLVAGGVLGVLGVVGITFTRTRVSLQILPGGGAVAFRY